MSKKVNAAAVAGMIAGHKLYRERASGKDSSASAPNPYHKARNLEEVVCSKAWAGGLAEGMKHAKNGLTFKQLSAILLEVRK